MSRSTAIKLPALDLSSLRAPPLRPRARSNSIVKVEEVGDRSIDEVLDRGAYVNINADWVNAKGASPWFLSHICPQPIPQGAWLIHVVLIILGKIIIDTVPGMTQQISWTLVNLLYLAVCPPP